MVDETGEDSWIPGMAAGGEGAFERLYDAFAGRLFRAAMAILRSREDAEDAVQEAFLGVLRSRDRIRAVADLEAYLFASLRNAAIRRLEARKREVTLEEHLRAVAERRGGPAEEPVDPGPLDRALRELPLEQREVLALKIDGGLTFARIAAVLGVSPNTAASRYRYALEKLRERLKGGRP